MTQEIDRQALTIIAGIEQELSTFRGIRHLWANQVANGRISINGDTTIDPDLLAIEQKTRLWSLISRALSLHDYLWPEGTGTPHRRYRRDLETTVSPQEEQTE